MANAKRIPFVLNLDDPVDCAIWDALQPLLARRRASQFIRGTVAQALGIGGLLPPVSLPSSTNGNGHSPVKALPAGEPRAKRPTRKATIQDQPLDDGDSENGLDEATDNFLSMFG